MPGSQSLAEAKTTAWPSAALCAARGRRRSVDVRCNTRLRLSVEGATAPTDPPQKERPEHGASSCQPSLACATNAVSHSSAQPEPDPEPDNTGEGSLAEEIIATTRQLLWLIRFEAIDSIPASYARVLNRVADAPLTMREVADVIGLSPPSATAMIHRMEEQGIVRRVRSATDRRTVLVELTEVGDWLRRSRRGDAVRTVDTVLAELTPTQKAAVAAGYRALTEAMAAHRAVPRSDDS